MPTAKPPTQLTEPAHGVPTQARPDDRPRDRDRLPDGGRPQTAAASRSATLPEPPADPPGPTAVGWRAPGVVAGGVAALGGADAPLPVDDAVASADRLVARSWNEPSGDAVDRMVSALAVDPSPDPFVAQAVAGPIAAALHGIAADTLRFDDMARTAAAGMLAAAPSPRSLLADVPASALQAASTLVAEMGRYDHAVIELLTRTLQADETLGAVARGLCSLAHYDRLAEATGLATIASVADVVAPLGRAEEIGRFADLVAPAFALPTATWGGGLDLVASLSDGLIGGFAESVAGFGLTGLSEQVAPDPWAGQAVAGVAATLAGFGHLAAPTIGDLEAGLGLDRWFADGVGGLVAEGIAEWFDPLADAFGAGAVVGQIFTDREWSIGAIEAAARAMAGLDLGTGWRDALVGDAAAALAGLADLVAPAEVAIDPFERDLLLAEDPATDPAARHAALERLAAPFDRLVGRRWLWPALDARAARLQVLGLAANPRSVLREEVMGAIVLVLGSADTPQFVRVGDGWLTTAAGRKAVVVPNDLPWDRFDGWFRAEVARRVEASLRDRPDRLLVPRRVGWNTSDRDAPLAGATSLLLADPGAVDPLHALLARETSEEQVALLDACAAAATPRQREILGLLRQGRDYAGAARLLGISPKTVRAQMTFLRQRLRAA